MARRRSSDARRPHPEMGALAAAMRAGAVRLPRLRPGMGSPAARAELGDRLSRRRRYTYRPLTPRAACPGAAG
jgi:hypothetical protein